MLTRHLHKLVRCSETDYDNASTSSLGTPAGESSVTMQHPDPDSWIPPPGQAMTISMRRNRRDPARARNKIVMIAITSICTCSTPPLQDITSIIQISCLPHTISYEFYEHCSQIKSFPHDGNPGSTMRKETKHGIFVRQPCIYGPGVLRYVVLHALSMLSGSI